MHDKIRAAETALNDLKATIDRVRPTTSPMSLDAKSILEKAWDRAAEEFEVHDFEGCRDVLDVMRSECLDTLTATEWQVAEARLVSRLDGAFGETAREIAGQPDTDAEPEPADPIDGLDEPEGDDFDED